jgi:hypothetical protein
VLINVVTLEWQLGLLYWWLQLNLKIDALYPTQNLLALLGFLAAPLFFRLARAGTKN